MHCHYIAVSLSHGVKLYHRKSQKANRCTQPPKRVPSWHFPPFLLAGTGLCSLFTFRGLLLCDTLTQRQPAAHERQEAVRFRRIAPYGAWTRQPARSHV
nr:MAG TPA: hypothetical protein [Caudoviricetes sp.]